MMLTRAEIGSNLSAKCKIYSQQTQRMDKRFNSNSMIINRRVIRSKTITKASNKTEQQESTATTATKKSATQKVQNKEDVDVLFNNMVKKLKKNKKTEIIPIFCRLSSQAVTISNFLRQPKALKAGFQALRVAGIRGVHVTVFWGIVEGAPRVYDWDAYEQLFEIVESVGELEVSVEFAFHAKACGGNDGDACTASLPVWVHDQAEANPELFYKDQSGLRENVVISLFAEEDKNLLPTNVKGERRSAIQCYEDFMESFANKFQKYFENGTITTATVGSGPNGELRYPAFPEEVWEFPGIGSFQVNDKYALRKLKSVAMEKNCKDWGHSGPHDAGLVNDFGPVSNFFQDNGSWKTDYGQFFLSFYSEELVKHGDRMIKSAHNAIRSKYPDVELEMRIPNTYWWNHCESRPAQTTSGYPRFTDPSRDAFDDVMNMISRNNAHATVQGGELGDESIADSNATNAQANPEKSLSYVKQSASRNGVEYALETKAVEDFSDESFRMLYAHGMGVDDVCEANCNLQIFAEDCTTGDCSISKRAIVGEIGSKMFEPENWKRLVLFHQSMAGYNAWEVPAQKKKNNNRNNPATTVTTTSTTTMVENNDELNTKFAEMNHTNNSMNNLNTSSVVANQQHQNSSSCTSSR